MGINRFKIWLKQRTCTWILITLVFGKIVRSTIKFGNGNRLNTETVDSVQSPHTNNHYTLRFLLKGGFTQAMFNRYCLCLCSKRSQ
ncbi:Uncharacterised protein [Vibrio cholerae]|nr:Uncharacterised protein [Vibrio cholerae]